ncbi:MAG: hypothetical protein HYW86_05480 [Candidatus Roizmanbacteria bacterium]|nr:MAG: hypothetical protein HYW86_05480 [Candidatus Roizmanbacteria bacterium]
MKNIIIIIVITVIAVIQATEARAQQVSLSISPPLLEVAIKPGKSILIAYTLRNYGDPTILKARILPFEPLGSTGNIKIKNELEGPIQFFLDNADFNLGQPFFLKSADSQQLLLRIKAAEGTPEGDYYYTLLNETEPSAGLSGVSLSQAKATLGSNILITVTESGKIDIQGKISLFDVISRYSFSFFGRQLKLFDSSDLIPVTIQVENRGKNFIKPEGQIELRGNFGEKAEYSIIPKNILSESQRLLSATPSAALDCEDKKNNKLCKSPVSLLISGFFIGSYKLSTTVSFGDGSPNLYASASFIALPLKLILGVLTTFILGFFLIIKMRKS